MQQYQIDYYINLNHRAFHYYMGCSTLIMKKIQILLLLLILSGCSKIIEIDLDNNKALVLNSLFNTDSLFAFRISTTASLLNEYDTLNEKLQFSLFEEDKLIFECVSQTNLIKTEIKPIQKRKYSVEVKSDNFPPVNASDTIPELVPIDNANMIFPAAVDASGSYLAEANVSFSDPLVKKTIMS